MLRILVCGSRDWSEEKPIRQALEKYVEDNPVIITGGARGADTIAHNIAVEFGLETEVYVPDWNKYGKAAGPIRNKEMLIEGKPTLVLAFAKDLENSRGTKNMVEQSRKAGVKVIVSK
jgi:hypothetical protein